MATIKSKDSEVVKNNYVNERTKSFTFRVDQEDFDKMSMFVHDQSIKNGFSVTVSDLVRQAIKLWISNNIK